MAITNQPSRPNELSGNETFTTFQEWRKNLIVYLNLNTNFHQFLEPTTIWSEKNSKTKYRGFDSAQTCQRLDQFLRIIASLVPSPLYEGIVEDSTSTSSVFQLIQSYYQFEPSEGNFLKFSDIKRECKDGVQENPLHLYLRMRQFVRDNLLSCTSNIQHDGKILTADETLSPTTERLVVLRWLEVLHPALPNHVAKVFANELQSKSLKDLQPRIAEQIDELILYVANTEKENVSSSFGSPRRFNVDDRNSYVTLNRNENSISPDDRWKTVHHMRAVQARYTGRDRERAVRDYTRDPFPIACASSTPKCRACTKGVEYRTPLGETINGDNIYNLPYVFYQRT